MKIETENMLKTPFVFDDYEFTQVDRIGDVVLLAKRQVKRKPIWAKNVFTYEVVIVQKAEAATLSFGSGLSYPNREIMPRSEQWGEQGWSYQDLDSARKRFDRLVVEGTGANKNQTPIGTKAFSPPNQSAET